MPTADDLAHLHCHFHTSGFDGLGEAEQFVERAAEMGQTAISLTDHGTLRGLYEAQIACDKARVKLIPGCEFYVTDDASKRGATPEEKEAVMAAHATVAAGKQALKDDDQRRRSRDHVTVWALNQEGLRNLYRLSGWSWSEGFYYKPRIDLARLREYGAGLAVSTGCPGGVVAGPLGAGRTGDALDRAEELAEIFGDRFYVEIMPHVIEGRDRVASRLLRIASDYGARVVATQDAHYPTAMDAAAQDALLCVHTRSRLCDDDRFCFDSNNYWLRSRAELEAAFATSLPGLDRSVVRNAINETNALAERCTARLDLGKPGKHLVAPDVPVEFDGDFDQWLLALCKAGVRDRFGCDLRALGGDYRARLLHELRTIRDLGFAGYFVAVWDVRQWARAKAGILCGPGRGSAAGSLVSYVLRITDLDPVLHGLSFERFLAPGRVDLPDIDCDFESVRRDEVIGYLRNTYGDDRVAHISTHNTIGGKRALRDLGRIYSIPDHLTTPLLPLIADDEGGKSLATAMRNTAPGQVLAQQFPQVVDVAARLEGNLRDVGIHAAGVVLASSPLRDLVPMETRPPRAGNPNRVPAVAFDWHGAEAMGLVKLDVLGLTTLTTVATALRLARRDVGQIDLHDPAALAVFNAGAFAGVFQYDTPSSRRICKGFEFRDFSDVCVITALNRPGPITSGLVTEFMARRADPTKVYSVHPIYDEIMAETLGVPVYQEQVVALARRLAGYSAEDADKFRKAISKKDGFEDHEDRFVGGACDAGMDPAAARQLWQQLIGFAKYAFNKAHSYSYGALAVWTAWLKAHCPAAFYAASMATSEDEEARLRLASEARRMGVAIMPPSVQVGGEGFALRTLPDGSEEIVGSVADIKGVGPATAAAIAKRAPYLNLFDFYRQTAGSGVRVTAKTFEALARATALRDLVPSSRPLVDNPKAVWEALAAVHKVKAEGAPKAKRKKDAAPAPTESEATAEAWAELDRATRLAGPEYTQDEWIRVVSSVWPLYVSLEGRSLFDAELAKARDRCKRGDVYLPGEPLEVGQFVVMFARVASLKVYREEGGQTGRVMLTVPGGGEVVGRMDSDVVEAYASGIAEGGLVLAAAYCHKEGRVAVEAIWPAGFDGSSHLLDRVMRPAKTKPRNPGSAMRAAEDGDRFDVQGTVLRVRRHVDKSGGRMMTVGLLGERGYVRFFVFARRAKMADCNDIVPGALASVRLTKLTDASCLSDGPAALKLF